MTSLETPPLSAGQAAPDSRTLRLVRILLPFVVLAAGIAIWELVVRLNDIPPYVLPGPGAVLRTLVQDWPLLFQSLLTTLLTARPTRPESSSSRTNLAGGCGGTWVRIGHCGLYRLNAGCGAHRSMCAAK